jgi:hypothetical protein
MTLQRVAYGVAAVIGVGIIAIGTRFLVDPAAGAAGFGLASPATVDPYLAVKGVRDIGSGLILLTLMATRQRRAVAWAMLAASFIPIGDMLIVLGYGGPTWVALGIHGATAAVALAAAVVLLRAGQRVPTNGTLVG